MVSTTKTLPGYVGFDMSDFDCLPATLTPSVALQPVLPGSACGCRGTLETVAPS